MLQISEKTKNYILMIITVLLFTYFASGLAAQQQVPTGTVVIPSV